MTAQGPRVMLDAHRVGKNYGDEVALHEVSIDVRAGRIHALVGLNGAGKTTLMRSMLGMVRPETGSVSLRCDAGMLPIGRAASADWGHVGHLIETPFTYPELTVIETVATSARLHGVPRSDATTAAEAMMGRLELDHWAQRRSHTLSLGNRQRLGLACALVHRPSLMILDEPANGLDPAGVYLIRALLREAASTGAAILISSHHLDEMARIADTISVMHRGRVIGTLSPHGTDIERQFFDMVYASEDAQAGGQR